VTTVISLNSIAGRFAIFVLGHVVVLGLVIVLSMSAGQAVPDRSASAISVDETTTGSIRH
jgi:hypothetical protein